MHARGKAGAGKRRSVATSVSRRAVVSGRVGEPRRRNSHEARRHDGCLVLLGMNWRRCLREMVLAGGALAVAACSSSDRTSDASAQGAPDEGGCGACPAACISAGPDSPECECVSDGGIWNNGGCSLPVPEAASPDAETPDAGPTDAGPGDAALESSSASLQCGGGPFSGAGTDPCTNAGGVCVQLPDPSCCDLVPGFDPTNSGCPHAAFAIRCCALDGDAGKATDASAE